MRNSDETARKRRRYSTNEQRLEAIKQVDSGATHGAVAARIGVSRTTVTMWMNEATRAKIAAGSSSAQRLATVRHPNLEAAVLRWLDAIRLQNIPVSGPLLQQAAMRMATRAGIRDFAASDGWLGSFRERNKIRLRGLAGEADSVDMEVVRQSRQDLAAVLTSYDPEDTYNADETALFYKCGSGGVQRVC